MRIAVNARVTAFSMGGQQRVAAEVGRRLHAAEFIAPSRPLGGVSGHLWEQFVLPLRARGTLLWSPSATGPILTRRQVVTLHDIAFLDVPEYFSRSFRAFYKLLTPRLVRNAAHVVTVSEFSRGRIMERLSVPDDRISVIPNGVADMFRLYSPTDVAATRAALDLPQRYFLLQATADRRKNLPRTLAAWARAQRELPDDLMLVVSGNLGRTHVFGEVGDIAQTPRTRLLGYVDDAHMGPLLAGAEAFLFPSLYEGFGLPIVEAMACGAPVLTADATATREIAGEAALLVDPASEDSIARGIVAFAKDPALRAKFAAAGIAHARRFTWDNAAARYEALFERLSQSQ
jgi:glycosyltransferase involved in cell wall biosynthesis